MRNFLTVCFWFPQQKANIRTQRQSICSYITPHIHLLKVMFVHPGLNCRYQNRALIIYTLCTSPWTPVLVPLQLNKDKPFLPSGSSVCTSKSHIYTMKALSNGSAMFFMFVIYTMALWMKCMLSFNNYQADMETTKKHADVKKNSNWIKTREFKIYRLIFFLFSFLHQLTVNRTHDASDPCSLLPGDFRTETMTAEIWSTTTHQKKTKQNKTHPFQIIPRFQIQSKDMKSLERHIQLTINIPDVWYVRHLNLLSFKWGELWGK